MRGKTAVVVNYILALVLVLGLNFMLPRLLPGDPLTAIYGAEVQAQLTPELRASLEERLALNQSLPEQLGAYVQGLVTGDLGYSYYYHAPVAEVVFSFLPWTLLLAGGALFLSTILGIVLGIESGWHRGGGRDTALLTGIMFLSGLPDFFIGILLLLFGGVLLGLFPLSGAMTPYAGLTGLALVLDVLHHLVLPLTALTLAGLSGAYLLTRNTMVTVLKAPFLLTARAKGLPARTVRYRHAGRNALLPVVTRTGVVVGRMATGVLFVEAVFSYPGLGQLMYNALLTRDYPVLQGIFLVITVTVLTVSFLMDILYVRLDPRVVYAH